MTIFYLPLEAYRERYTKQLRDWTLSCFQRRGVAYQEVLGDSAEETLVQTGVVLDAHRRSQYALTQMAFLVGLLQTGVVSSQDVIYLQDMFHPGYEALPYIFEQTHVWPRIFLRNWAQSIDPDDFTFSMRRWMRLYEMLVDRSAAGVFLASMCQVEMSRLALLECPLHVVGLPFDQDEVRGHVALLACWSDRPKRILFSSRLDAEKQPHFYFDLIEYACSQQVLSEYEFAVCTSAARLRSNQAGVIERAYALRDAGKLAVYENLTKNDYYALLSNSRIQFNCARQDFVSFTMLEASAFGTITLAPAYKSFPEALFHSPRQLYVPWSVPDALARLVAAIENPPLEDVGRPAEFHSNTLDRELDVLCEFI